MIRLMLLTSILGQVAEPVPVDLPSWLWAALGAIGVWLAREFWPFVKSRFEHAEARMERGDQTQDERFLRATEEWSRSMAQVAAALEKIAQSLDLFARTQVAVEFQLQELRRELHGAAPRPAAEATLTRLMGEEPRP